ncbi:hypothetical protein [Streptomyces neyagawaensis]|uniref:hypothetical protein n=1 Tax=Streptomyces neyagawaensis TaxID=42238 RepID=UPI0006E1702F|nr:hypothetical protein [Streptomyces neyagawaensis]MCL6737372.1 hypothetical protein [Streptomyces neyagawaensis]MDE1681672.1 hypothetical protein [Streptomyces neyagawaensis]
MNAERPDHPENPDEGTRPDTTEEIRAAGDRAEGVEKTDPAQAEEAPATGPGDDEARARSAGPADEDGDERPGPAKVVDDGGDDRGGPDEGDEAREARTADESEVAEVGRGDVGQAEAPDVEDAPRAARRRSRVVVASVAAAVLLVGGGGAFLAATTSGGSGDGSGRSAGSDGTPPPLALDGYGGGGSNGIAPGEPDPNGVTYRADGKLPDGPDSAPVYRAEGQVTAAEVARLAKALGVEGGPRAEGESWRVGTTRDGSGPTLHVGRQAPGAWTFSRFTPGTDNCQKVDVCTAVPPAGDTDPVSEAAARKAATPILKAVGQDDAKLDVSQLLGTVRVVNADPEVGGLPTYGWATNLQVGADGTVVGGSGNVKAPVKGDTYPVVDAERALKLLNDSGQGVGPAREDVTPSPSMPRTPPVRVEDAVFGLASHQVGGRPALVPSWLFEVRPRKAAAGFTVTHPAVDPKYLTPSEPEGEPTEGPEDPNVPGDRPPADPASRNVPVQGYTADGRELTVSFWGGVCSEYTATATEKSGEVTVTVTGTSQPGRVCVMIAKAMERTVRLDGPLGDREVVGPDGEEIPEGGIREMQPQ